MRNLILFFAFAFIAFFTTTTMATPTGGHCNGNYIYKTVKNGGVYAAGKDIYVKVGAQNHYDIQYMDLYINGYRVRREMNAPYEWGRPNGGGDQYLRNMKPGTYKLKCIATTRCGRTHKKEITIYVKKKNNGYCNTNYWYMTAKHGQHCQKGKDLYVKVGAQKASDVEYMELYINGYRVRREMNAPYEWGRPNGGSDQYLRNMKPGTYQLKCKIKTRCGEIIWKKSTVYVKH
ncbi:MAG: hypothetical protein AAF960_01125 [Bacteroidota bacterium]